MSERGAPPLSLLARARDLDPPAWARLDELGRAHWGSRSEATAFPSVERMHAALPRALATKIEEFYELSPAERELRAIQEPWLGLFQPRAIDETASELRELYMVEEPDPDLPLLEGVDVFYIHSSQGWLCSLPAPRGIGKPTWRESFREACPFQSMEAARDALSWMVQGQHEASIVRAHASPQSISRVPGTDGSPDQARLSALIESRGLQLALPGGSLANPAPNLHRSL